MKLVNITLFVIGIGFLCWGFLTTHHQNNHNPDPIKKTIWVGKNPKLAETCNLECITITSKDLEEVAKKATTTWIVKDYKDDLKLWFETPDSKYAMYYQLIIQNPSTFYLDSISIEDSKTLLTWNHRSHGETIFIQFFLGVFFILMSVLLWILCDGLYWIQKHLVKKNKGCNKNDGANSNFIPDYNTLPIIPKDATRE